MNLYSISILGCVLFFIIVFYLGRLLYKKNLHLRNRLQMDDVYASITHDLLTPLTVISASIDHLREEEPKYGFDYDIMQLNIQRMTRQLQQILETSKSQSGELKLKVTNGDVMKFIRETALCVKPLMAKNGLEYDIQCSPESMMGWIDTEKVDKIIYNLLSNAAKFTTVEDGKISLQVKTNNKYDRIIIQVSHNDTDNDDSTYDDSLDFALTRELVYLHRGTIKIDKEEGKGTTYTVSVPINKESFSPNQIDEKSKMPVNIAAYTQKDNGQPALPEPAENVLSANASKILLVEDNEELLILMRHLLMSKYHVTTARNGREALRIILRTELDLIVSDVMTPGMSGNELTRIIKNDPHYSYLPIILISSKTEEEERIKSLTLGADEYITKPFKLGDLQLRIDNLISNRQRIQREYMGTTNEEGGLRTSMVTTPEDEFLKRAVDMVTAHLSDSDYDRDTFAADMGASTSTLYNKLRALTGLNVSNFIRDIRMKNAERIVRETPDIRVSDLAYRVGFKDPKYFSTCFKKSFGMQPKEFIEKVATREL